ncbi:MAG: response regulator transcription factor [Oscillospiraceae bacterium]|nr:response regulator transcription factor [Oscillospiraceae bacterium]
MTGVFIVDDHESMRETLSRAFSDAGDFMVVGETPSAALALAYCEKLRPDLVLMDVCTEGNASGLAATREIRDKLPEVKVVVMTAFNEISYLPRAKEAGANGFVYKSRSLAFFLETARAVMNGESVFPQAKTIPMPTGEAPLTDREMEILRLLCRHMTNKEIGAELFISENTVKYHKANMLAKTGFDSAVDLAFYMITNGWINPLY